MKKMLMVLWAFSLTTLFAAGEAQLNVNKTDLELSVKFDVQKGFGVVEDFESSEGNSRSNQFGIRFIKADVENSSLPSTADLDYYAEINYLMMQNIGHDGFRAGIGAKINYTEDFVSVPFGLEAQYKFEEIPNVPVKIGASVYYAPPVLTFENGDSYVETGINVAFEIIRDAELVFGYRNMKTNMEGYDMDYNEAGYFGVKMKF